MCAMMVVMSDDPDFLATFGEWSLKSSLLVGSSKLLILTHLPLAQLQGLHGVVSMMNAVIGILSKEVHVDRRHEDSLQKNLYKYL